MSYTTTDADALDDQLDYQVDLVSEISVSDEESAQPTTITENFTASQNNDSAKREKRKKQRQKQKERKRAKLLELQDTNASIIQSPDTLSDLLNNYIKSIYSDLTDVELSDKVIKGIIAYYSFFFYFTLLTHYKHLTLKIRSASANLKQ